MTRNIFRKHKACSDTGGQQSETLLWNMVTYNVEEIRYVFLVDAGIICDNASILMASTKDAPSR